MAQRYDQKKKDTVVAFVKQHNEQHGRGGQSAAAKKYGINPITIRSWLEKAGVTTPGKGGKKKRATSSRVRKVTRRATSSVKRSPTPRRGSSVSVTLLRMARIQSEIEALQAEYHALKEKI